MIKKLILVAMLPLLLVSCKCEKSASVSATVSSAPAEVDIPVEEYLMAVNRSFERVEESCWDSKSELLLARFSLIGTEEQAKGWSVLTGWEFKALSNGTILFIEDELGITAVTPDVTRLPCVTK